MYRLVGTPKCFQNDYLSPTDVHECALGSCSIYAECTNTPGSFFCICRAGYMGDGTTCTGTHPTNIFFQKTYFYQCADIDECAQGTDNCAPNVECMNVQGSFKCVCREGFEGNGTLCTGKYGTATCMRKVANVYGCPVKVFYI